MTATPCGPCIRLRTGNTIDKFAIAWLLGVAAAAPAWADQALAASKNCMACHAVDRKVVGPAFKAVAARYAGQGDATTYLANKITKGSAGAWGVVPMPPNAQVGDADARKLAEWILSVKEPRP